MPRPTHESQMAGIPSPSTSARIAGRPCTGSPAVNRKWWRSPRAPSPVLCSRRLLEPSMPNIGIDRFRTCQQVIIRRLSSRGRLVAFRYRGRQLVHVVNDQHRPACPQTGPVLRPAMTSPGEADCSHAGGEGGIDTCRAVLNDETAVRRRHKVLRGI
jgi:hypothetical protein